MSARAKYPDAFDCIVVGAGPAGLLAATYLGRYRRRVVVADAGDSRARRIPRINNCPGFPDGISGRDLLARLREQAALYGARFFDRAVESIERTEAGFAADCGAVRLRAPRLLLATGVVDLIPDLPEIDKNIDRGTLRLCPVCDGFEAVDKKIAVFGISDHALREAVFLRTYSPNVTLLANDPDQVPAHIRAGAGKAGIGICDNAGDIQSGSGGYEALLRDGEKRPFDVIYPALGCNVRSELAVAVGVQRDEAGHILVGPHQRASVDGIFAAGDVVHSLNQIAVAFGQAATAATAIHNSLGAEDVKE